MIGGPSSTGGSRVTSRLSEVYAIIDAELSDDPIALARRAVSAGCPMLQLRAKHLDDRSSIELALALRTLCKGAGAAFASKYAGYTSQQVTHDFEQAAEAEREGADLIAFGPVFETKTKKNPDPVVGLGRLAELCRSVSRPVVAIGGITPENARETLDAGACYIAVVSALPRFLERR